MHSGQSFDKQTTIDKNGDRIMKSPRDVFPFWCFLAIQVNGFELHTADLARRMPTQGCGHSHGIHSHAKENSFFSVFRTELFDDSNCDAHDTRNKPSSTKEVNAAIRSTLSTALALAILTFSFVETATAEPLSQSLPDFQTTMTVADSRTDSLPPTTQLESQGSPAGNAVLGAWVGISGFAGIKGVYDRIQQEREDNRG